MNRGYLIETRERLNNTDAYHEQKTSNYTKKWAEANDDLMAIFAEFFACKDSGESADSAEAQALVAKLQAHITAYYYTCTDEILAVLGKMHICDEQFKKTSIHTVTELRNLYWKHYLCNDYKKLDEEGQFYLHKSIAGLKVNQSAQNPITYLSPINN